MKKKSPSSSVKKLRPWPRKCALIASRRAVASSADSLIRSLLSASLSVELIGGGGAVPGRGRSPDREPRVGAVSVGQACVGDSADEMCLVLGIEAVPLLLE